MVSLLDEDEGKMEIRPICSHDWGERFPSTFAGGNKTGLFQRTIFVGISREYKREIGSQINNSCGKIEMNKLPNKNLLKEIVEKRLLQVPVEIKKFFPTVIAKSEVDWYVVSTNTYFLLAFIDLVADLGDVDENNDFPSLCNCGRRFLCLGKRD